MTASKYSINEVVEEFMRINKDEIAKWVLSFQVHPEVNDDIGAGLFYGFCGSRSTQFSLLNAKAPCLNVSHLASTYSALAILKIIGYDLASIDCKALPLSLKRLQQPDGRDKSLMEGFKGEETSPVIPAMPFGLELS